MFREAGAEAGLEAAQAVVRFRGVVLALRKDSSLERKERMAVEDWVVALRGKLMVWILEG